MNARRKALDLLIDRRPFAPGSPDWAYRTRAAWKFLQIHMGKPAAKWTANPPVYRGATK